MKAKNSFNNGLNNKASWLDDGIATMSFTKDGKPQLIINQAFAPRMRPDKADESLIKPEPLFLFPLEERVVNNGEADEKSKTA